MFGTDSVKRTYESHSYINDKPFIKASTLEKTDKSQPLTISLRIGKCMYCVQAVRIKVHENSVVPVLIVRLSDSSNQ